MENKIEKEELMKQYNENIKESEHYIEVNFVIGKEEKATMPMVDIHNVGDKEIAVALVVLKSITKQLEEKYPLAKIMTFFIGTEGKEL